jgi:hypothetical protein
MVALVSLRRVTKTWNVRGAPSLQLHDFIFTHQLQPSINVKITDPSPYHWIMIR